MTNFFGSYKRILGLLAVLVMGAGGVAPFEDFRALADVHQHDHGAHQLKLDNGRKWATDAPLRQGMERIRALREGLPPTASAEELQAFVKGMEEQVEYLIENCKLPQEADETLHVVIGELQEGADVLTTKGDPARGLKVIDEALHGYAEYFDHEGWKAP